MLPETPFSTSATKNCLTELIYFVQNYVGHIKLFEFCCVNSSNLINYLVVKHKTPVFYFIKNRKRESKEIK